MAGIVWDAVTITVGALTAQSAITVNSKIDPSRLQGFRVLRTEWYLGMRSATTGDGPFVVGLSHDLTGDEVSTCIGGDPQRSNDPVESEEANRPVWAITALHPNADGDGKIVDHGVTKIGWSIPEGTSLKWWVMNGGNITLTTGAVVNILAKHFGVWLKD